MNIRPNYFYDDVNFDSFQRIDPFFPSRQLGFRSYAVADSSQVLAGFDTKSYPAHGLSTMDWLIHNTNLRVVGYYLAPAPSRSDATWMGHLGDLISDGWIVAPIYVGEQDENSTSPLFSKDPSASKGVTDGNATASLLHSEGFGSGTTVYLDIETGSPLSSLEQAYISNWCATIAADGFKAGVYCPGSDANTVLSLVPNAVLWLADIGIMTANAGTTTFPTEDPSGSGHPSASAWQYQWGFSISTPNGSLGVDLDTFRIETTNSAQPDLLIDNILPTSTTITQGTGISFSAQVRNAGNADITGDFKTIIYLSSGNAVYDPNDPADHIIETVTQHSLSAGDTFSIENSVSLADIPVGSYYLGIYTDYYGAVDESNEVNNSFAYATLITITANAPSDDYAADTGTTGTVTPGGAQVSGDIEVSGDRDWFKVHVTNGLTYVVDLVSGTTPQVTPFLSDPQLYLFNSSSQQIASNDDANGGLNSELTFKADYTGDYFIAAAGHGNSTGTYRLSVSAGSGSSDETPPTLSSSSPTDNATNVAVNANISLTFNESVKPGSGNIVIHDAGTGNAVATIAVTDTDQVSFSGSTMTVNPTANLGAGGHYYVTMASGVVTDLAGNAYAGISSSTALDFTVVSDAEALPDLTVTLLSIGSTNIVQGATTSLGFQVNNITDVASPGPSCGIYISTDSVIDPGSDRLLLALPAGFTGSQISANGQVGATSDIQIPSDLLPGSYYIGIVADEGKSITESNETNNVSNIVLITVTAAVHVVNGDNNANSLPGTPGPDAINGKGGDDTLNGLDGNDTLDGGTGADSMFGSFGDDTYIVDNPGDKVTEFVNRGTDLVKASLSYTLPDNVENLTLTGTQNLNGTGNKLANTIIGNSGNNILDGNTGADTLNGGYGDDTYIVDNPGDIVTEFVGRGTDLVKASVSYTLANNVENLTLTGSNNINATGNGLVNLLIGNGGNNVLDGKGGADTLNGGYGDDTYIVDNAGDVVTEFVGRGTDLVEALVSYTLASNVENLTLTGTGNINAMGNGLANLLIGNSGNNILDGKGGADTLNGGYGNDTYIVDNPGDVVTEFSGRGADLVKASVSYTLAGNVENLTLTGTGAISATGNTLANIIIGNSGANILRGMQGNDTMTGGGGADRFVFEHAGSANGVDHITDFVSAQDLLVFTGADYGFAAGHHLSAAEFHVGAAVGTNAQFIYDPVTHTLIFDSNGTGAGGHTAIVIFDNGATPQASDFVFV